MKKARGNQLAYLFLAVIVIPMGVYLNYKPLLDGQFPESVMLFFLGTSAFMMAYLSPHLFPKDERAKTIIGKSMSVNYFVLFVAITVLLLIANHQNISATHALISLFCVMVTTIPLSMIVYAKRI